MAQCFRIETIGRIGSIVLAILEVQVDPNMEVKGPKYHCCCWDLILWHLGTWILRDVLRHAGSANGVEQ